MIKIARIAAIDEPDWIKLDLKKQSLDFEKTPIEHDFPVFNLRKPALMKTIFMQFVTDELLMKVLSSIKDENLVLSQKKSWVYQPKLSDAYKALAISIRIQGLQNKPQENRKNHRPLKESINLAITHFRSTFPDVQVLTFEKASKLLTHCVFTNDFYPEICANFQNSVKTLGQFVAGDEKLLHFT